MQNWQTVLYCCASLGGIGVLVKRPARSENVGMAPVYQPLHADRLDRSGNIGADDLEAYGGSVTLAIPLN